MAKSRRNWPLAAELAVMIALVGAQDSQTREGPVRFDPPASIAARPAVDEAATPFDPDTGASQRVTAEQAENERAARERLNREQAEFAARQLADNAAAKEAWEQAKREREAGIARQQAEHRAQIARQEREHTAAIDRWRADVAACKAGDKSRCGKDAAPR